MYFLNHLFPFTYFTSQGHFGKEFLGGKLGQAEVELDSFTPEQMVQQLDEKMTENGSDRD